MAIHQPRYALSNTSLASTSPRPLSIPTHPSPPTRPTPSNITPLSSTISEEFLPTTTNDPFCSPPLGSFVVRSHSNPRSRSSLRTKKRVEEGIIPAVPSIPPEFKRGRTRERELSGSKSLDGETTIEEEKDEDYEDYEAAQPTEVEEREAPTPALSTPSIGKQRRRKGVKISITTSGSNVKRKRRSPNILSPRPLSSSSRPRTPVVTRTLTRSRPSSSRVETTSPTTPSQSRPGSSLTSAVQSPQGLADVIQAPQSSPMPDGSNAEPVPQPIVVQFGSGPILSELHPVGDSEMYRRIRTEPQAKLNHTEEPAPCGETTPSEEVRRPETSTAWAVDGSLQALGMGISEIQQHSVEPPVNRSRNPPANVVSSHAEIQRRRVDTPLNRSRNPSIDHTPVQPEQVALLGRVMRGLLDLPSRPLFGVQAFPHGEDERKSGESTQTPTPIARTPKQSPKIPSAALPELLGTSKEQVSEFGELLAAGPGAHGGRARVGGLVPLRHYGPLRFPTEDVVMTLNPTGAPTGDAIVEQGSRPGTPFETASTKRSVAFRRPPPTRKPHPPSEQSSDKVNDLNPPSSFPRSHFSVSPPSSFVASKPIDVPRARVRTDRPDHLGNEVVPRIDYMRPRSSWPPSSVSSSWRPAKQVARQIAKTDVDSSWVDRLPRPVPALKQPKVAKTTRFYISSSSEVTSDSGYAASHDSISPPAEPDQRANPES